MMVYSKIYPQLRRAGTGSKTTRRTQDHERAFNQFVTLRITPQIFLGSWNSNNALWGDVTGILVGTGVNKEDDLRYLKSVALEVWLFGYELPDTLMLFTKSELHVVASGKKGTLLRFTSFLRRSLTTSSSTTSFLPSKFSLDSNRTDAPPILMTTAKLVEAVIDSVNSQADVQIIVHNKPKGEDGKVQVSELLGHRQAPFSKNRRDWKGDWRR